MPANRRIALVIPLAALAFVATRLAVEHVTGGVQSHHLLNRADLPALSNWIGLITVPLLGVVLGQRVRRLPLAAGFAGIPAPVLAGLVGALLYGALLATAFEVGASNVTSAAFSGLFVCALLLPLYRAEYLFGFAVGMTVTFGPVLPVLVASVFAAVSFVGRFVIRSLATLVRGSREA